MGNCLKSCPVHPASGNGGRRGRGHVEEAGEKTERPLRIKVRMRRDKLEELLSLAHSDDDESNKIGFLILKECMEGRLPATASVLGSEDDDVSRRLGTIKEE